MSKQKNLCAYCGEDKRINPLKHIRELAKFLAEKIKECQDIIAKAEGVGNVK